MPLGDSLLNLKGFVIEKLKGINPVQLLARFVGEVECPRCNSKDVRKKTTFIRRIRHESLGNRRCEILLKAHKYHCRNCLRYFNQQFPGILKWHRATEGFRREVFEKHQMGISQVELARSVKIGTATVERWYHFFLNKKESELQTKKYSKYLGIDEHYFSKKQGFVTTLCNLDRHRILDILPGKSKEAIVPYLKKIEGREAVEMVCMDLCDHYRSIVKQVFPQARIVADRFHVIRLVNQAFLKTWHLLDPNAKYSRGLLSLMRRHPWNLKPHQIANLTHYMNRFPGLKSIYDFKQNLVRLLLKKHQTHYSVKPLIPKLLNFIKQLQNAHFDPLVTLGNTLNNWKEEIACMWRFTKSNGITEGFHRKMKLIQRRAYGFKNFENYRLRVRAACC